MQSRSRSSSSVRCGCQYFQSTDPLPERLSLVGTPPVSRQSTMGEQEDEREDDDKSKTPQQTKLVTPALAGLTTLLAASPILSVSPGKEGEVKTEEDGHERKCIRIPDDDGVIIPLHGDSDEEINPERYADPSLVVVQRTNEQVVEKIKPKKKGNAPKPPKKKNKSDSGSSTQKLVTPTLAGLTTVIAATPIISEPSETAENPKLNPEVRKFIRNPKDGTVIVPLHGDSDEEINPDRYEDPSLITKQRTDGPVIEEYEPPKSPGGTPRNEGLVEEEGTIIEMPDNEKSKSKPAESPVKKIISKDSEATKKTKKKESSKMVTPMLAGMTTLLAASPILSVSPEKEQGEGEENKTEEVHERKFIRIPNDDAIIIPIHGDSDEEINPERYDDPSLQGVQKIGEIVEEIKPANKVKSVESKPSKSGESEKKQASSPAAKLVTPTLAGMTTLLAASPILSVSPEKEHGEEVHERKFIRIPNEEAVIIPLHGDSDEEINPDRYEDPSLQGVQKIGEVVEEIKPVKKVRSMQSKPPKSGDSEKKEASSSTAKLVTPTLAGITTLLAASPILSVSPEKEHGGEDEQKTEEVHERKFIRIPDETAVIIPLHGDSDEEINPDRYDDPSLQGVQKIGEVVEEIKPVKKVKSSESKQSKVGESEKKQASSSAAKLVTPTLAGMTTLLAASPILSVSPEKERCEEAEQKTEEVHERKFIRIPNEEAVIIPLHGDSDEEINPDRYNDPSLQGVQKIGDVIEVIKPMKMVKDLESKSSKKGKAGETSSASKVVTPTLAGMTTLLAASPILSVSPTNEIGNEGDDEKSDAESKEEVRERKYIRIPDQQGVIIPLHGDSDEEINPERYTDPSLQGVQEIGEVVQDITPMRVKTRNKEVGSEAVKNEKETPASAKLVTPMLAGMTTLLAASPILTVSPNKDGLDSEIDGEGDKPIERKVIRMAGVQDVIVPLHGDSDEELHPERYEDPSLVGIQKIEGPTLEVPLRKPPLVEPKGKALKTAKIKAIAATEKATREAAKLVTPMLAGMTTLLASSPLLTVSPKKSEGQKMGEEVLESNEDPILKIEDTSLPEDTIERKFIRIPNQQAVIIPLHGDSDEDLHPDRYEDPDLQGVHSITGSVVEESIAPFKPCRTKPQEKVNHKLETQKKMVPEKPIEVNPVEPIPEKTSETIHSKEAVEAEVSETSAKVTEKIIGTKDKVVEAINEIAEGVENVATDSEIAPKKPAKRTKAKAPKEPPTSTASVTSNLPETTFETAAEPVREQQKEESIDQSNKEVHPARDHEYEPVNPKEPPSPPVGTRLSRADQANRASELEVSPTVSALVSAPAPASAPATVTAPVPAASSSSDQAAAAESKLVTPSLAGITTLLAASPILSISPQAEEEKKEEVIERKFIKIPNEKGIIIPLHGDSDEELHPERYKDPSLIGTQRIEGPVVEEIKAPPPQAKSPVEEVRPPEVKSPVEESKPSSQLKPVEQLKEEEYEPIQHPDDMALDEAQPLSIQDRFKAGAGEIRDKLRNMTVPKISLPDRPKINLPDRSKMKLPDRPQFLKERPQFLKERPQFLKERPQFLKERPQFLKEKPQFLKEKPKFLTQKPKFFTERPKFNLPDRSKFKVPERFKFEKSKKVDKPKIRKPNPSSVRRPLRDAITISSESSHNLFQTLKARTYPRFMTKKKREREKAAQLRAAGTSLETESSPPSPPVSSRQFPERYRDIKFADEDPGYVDQDQRMEVQSEEGYEENTAPFHERYEQSTPYITAQGPDGTLKAKIDSSSDIVESDKEQISSGASSMRHRVGVLEEIDSDEFFLRQKGLSREDVDVSRYLSKEIRDAFRSPRNVLAHMDSADSRYTDEYEGEEGSPDLRYRDEPPEPPGRTKNRSESRDSDFNTFPIKPTRRKHSEGDFGSKEIFEKIKKPPRKYRSKSDTRQGSVRSLDRSSRRSILFDDTPQPPSRQKSLRSLTRSRPESATDVRGGSVRRDVAHDMEITPVRPLRKSRSRGASVDERTSRGADSLPHDYGEYEQEEEEIDIEEEEMEEELEEEVPEHDVHEHVQVFRTIPVMTDIPVRSSAMDDEEIPGYATVRKPKPPRPPIPPKSRKEQLQSQLHSIKAQGINFFQTFPRRAMKSLNKPRLPVRPLRNYSALGPVRPPRRNRVFREPVYVDGDLPDSRAAGEDLKSYDLKHEYEETRDLQRGEIVERMKGRPLPPPPRPPRRSKDDDSWQSGAEEQEDICEPEEDICEPEEDICEPEEEEVLVIPAKPSRREEFLASLRVDVSGDHRQPIREVTSQATHAHPTIESSQQTSFQMPDVSVSIQTDPLPEGFIVDDRSEGYARSRSRTTESSGLSQIEQRQPERRPVEETIQRRHDSSLNDPRRLFDPDVIRASEYATDEAPPPLPHRNIPPIPITIPPITIPPIPPVQVSFPDKLHLAQLDVDKLNVNEIQANSIKVSDIDGVTMQISEIASASGHLVLNGIELPPDFIKNLVSKIPVPEPPKPIVIEKVIEKPVIIEKVIEKVIDRVRETTPQPQLKRILTPPPPIVVQHSAQSAEEVPSPPVQQASTVEQLPKPVSTRTRRKSPTRIVDDSEDELASVITERERKERERLEKEPKQEKKPDSEQESVPRTIPIISEEQPLEPSALALIKQLLSIWYRNIVSGTGSLVNGINSIFPENDKRRDAQTAAIILIVIIAALILLGIGADQSVHHHHWDYLNPPR